jgi:hypothetical protein
MPTVNEQNRRRIVDQTLASWRMEGFEPDAKYLALVEWYITGELSTDEIRRQLDEAKLRVSSPR